MKWILLFLLSFEAYGACSSISRSNATSSSILTSSKYNTDLNTVYNFVNSYDGGCISAGTVEAAALNSTEFGPILKAIVQGCEVNYVDTNTVSVSKCKIAVDGNLFETSSSNNVTWGCSGCSSEATGSYYVYVKDNPTFTLEINTTAPGKDGYSGTDKAVGGFYNNSSLDIIQGSVMTWVNSGVMPNPSNVPSAGSGIKIVSALIDGPGNITNEDEDFLSGCTNANPQVCSFNTGYWQDAPKCFALTTDTSNSYCYGATSASSFSIRCVDDTGSGVVNSRSKSLFCIGKRNGL